MRSIKWAVAVAAVSSLLGCGNSQPSIYRVAVDRLTAQNRPGTCFRTAPTTSPDTTTNTVDTKQWVIWEGLDGLMYLEAGGISYNMGDAPSVSITADAISGNKNDDGEYVFASERTVTQSANEVYATSATYTFEELGKTLKGTLALHATCTGSNCTGTPTCDVLLNFSGRQIDADRNIDFGSNSGG